MAYQAAQAVRMTDMGRAWERGRYVELDVIEGGGLDAGVRQGVSTGFVAYVRLVALAVILFVTLGVCRVAITTMTVERLTANLGLRSNIETAETVNSDLRIERSVLSSSVRITRIATQNYGMEYPTTHDCITLAIDGAEVEQPDAGHVLTPEGEVAPVTFAPKTNNVMAEVDPH